jgi:hypothetical protein
MGEYMHLCGGVKYSGHIPTGDGDRLSSDLETGRVAWLFLLALVCANESPHPVLDIPNAAIRLGYS